MYIFIDEDGTVLQSDEAVPSWEKAIESQQTFATLLFVPESGDLATFYGSDGNLHVIPRFP